MFKQEIEQMELVKTRCESLDTTYTTATRASQIECLAAALPRSRYANLGQGEKKCHATPAGTTGCKHLPNHRLSGPKS